MYLMRKHAGTPVSGTISLLCCRVNMPDNHIPGIRVPAEMNAAAADKAIAAFREIIRTYRGKNVVNRLVGDDSARCLRGLLVYFALLYVINTTALYILPGEMQVPEKTFIMDPFIVQRNHRLPAGDREEEDQQQDADS